MTTKLFVIFTVYLAINATGFACGVEANGAAVKAPKKPSTVKTKKDSQVVASQSESRPATETAGK